MFVTFLYRVRAVDARSAVFSAQLHMNKTGDANNFSQPLYVVCYESAQREVLVGPEDWRQREARARSYHKSLQREAQALAMAKELRFYWLFDLICGTPARRAIFATLQEEYFSYVDGPDKERTFFCATSSILREVLDDGNWTRETGTLDDYMRRREREITALLRHTTPESYPFTTAGPDLHQSKCFDLGGRGAVHYVVMDVHM